MQNKRKKLISLLFKTGRAMKEHFNEGGKHPHSMLHMETLGFVLENKNPSMKDIADHLCITPASTSNLIDGLVADRFLERIQEKNDRRIVRLKITKKGEAYIHKAVLHANKKMEGIFSKFNNKETDDFIKILGKFIEVLK